LLRPSLPASTWFWCKRSAAAAGHCTPTRTRNRESPIFVHTQRCTVIPHLHFLLLPSGATRCHLPLFFFFFCP
jgi:hypothetical protein